MSAETNFQGSDPISQEYRKPADLKAKLIHFFLSSGHVAEHAAEELADGAIEVAFGGKFGE